MLQITVVVAHCFAAVALFPVIRKRKEREEEWIHFGLIVLAAVVGAFSIILGETGGH